MRAPGIVTMTSPSAGVGGVMVPPLVPVSAPAATSAVPATLILYGAVVIHTGGLPLLWGQDWRNGIPTSLANAGAVAGARRSACHAPLLPGVLVGFSVTNAWAPTSTVFASALHAATTLLPVTLPSAKTTIAARMPSTTITMRSSI